MEKLRREYDSLQVAGQRRAALLRRAAPAQHLESLASKASVKVESMELQAFAPGEPYRERGRGGARARHAGQMVNYLHQIEQSNQVLSVKSLRVRNLPDTPELLDVSFTVSSFGRSVTAAAPARKG
jgi:hypothetical protein